LLRKKSVWARKILQCVNILLSKQTDNGEWKDSIGYKNLVTLDSIKPHMLSLYNAWGTAVIHSCILLNLTCMQFTHKIIIHVHVYDFVYHKFSSNPIICVTYHIAQTDVVNKRYGSYFFQHEATTAWYPCISTSGHPQYFGHN